MNKHSQPAAWREGAKVPRHIAVIMDGNGRWAAKRGFPRSVGHRAGVEAVRRIVRSAIELRVQHLTLYSFSSENWARPKSEVDDLMGLIKRFIRGDLAELHQNGVRISIIGARDGIDQELVALIEEAVDLTSDNTALDLIIAFNYGARAEIASAARKLAAKALKGEIKLEDIGEDALTAELDTASIPDPELLIRTSGEMRLSNFLLWQSAYTEFVFSPVLWPDFGHSELEAAIDEYNRRERRFGGVTTHPAQ